MMIIYNILHAYAFDFGIYKTRFPPSKVGQYGYQHLRYTLYFTRI